MRSIELDVVRNPVAQGLDGLDEQVVSEFARILPQGDYRIVLLSLVPDRVTAGSGADYFRSEQPIAWNAHDEPIDPGTDYYRPSGRSGFAAPEPGDVGFEFLVPLVWQERLDEGRIAFFEERLGTGAAPTAVSVGVLDIKQYWDSPVAHWCLSHFLLDGHHKVEAAARGGRPITLLSFIACDAGISEPDQVDRLLARYGRERMLTS